MSTEISAPRPQLTVKNKIGLALAALLGLGEITGPVSVPAIWAATVLLDDPNISSMGPWGVGMIVAGGALGLVTVGGVIYTWRTGNHVGARIVASACAVTALLGLPIFLTPDVPAWVLVIGAGLVVATIAAVILVLARPASPVLSPTADR